MLLSTKTLPPQSSTFVISRPRLFNKLHQSLTGKLTLITAPAGYGKTTLVSNWLVQEQELEHRTTWYLLDEYDDEPVRFMHYFIAALQQLEEDVGVTLQKMLQSSQVSPLPQTIESMMTVLINELSQSAVSALLILDDLHLISDNNIITGLRFWIEHAPSNIHTILISRDASMLPVARWRVRVQCTELTIHDLRFTEDEAITFVREMLRLDLGDDEILQLTERTEGWIAGLQLASMSLQTSENPAELLSQFTGSDRHVLDYLIEEVLEKQPKDIRDFLLQTSILRRLSPSLCEAVTGRSDSHSLLEQMEKRNLFLVPLDNQRQWYRYHPLFAESLRAHLRNSAQESSNQEDVSVYHQRAYRWFIDRGQTDEAIEHALASRQYEEAAACINKSSQTMLWHESRPQTFLRWCNELPKELLYGLPSLAISAGWAQLLSGQREPLHELTQGLRKAWASDQIDLSATPEIENELTVLEAEVALNQGQMAQAMDMLEKFDSSAETLTPTTRAISQQLYGYMHRLNGNIAAAKEYLHKAAESSEQTDQISIWLFSHVDLAETYAMAGELSTAEALFQKVLQRYSTNQFNDSPSLGYIYICLARVQYLQNLLVQATDNVQRGLSFGRSSPPVLQYGLMIQAELQQLQGNWSTIARLIKQIDESVRKYNSEQQQAFAAAFKAKQFLLQGEPKKVATWAATYQTLAKSIPRYQHHRMDITHARYLLVTGDPATIDRLEALREIAQQEGWTENLIEVNILLARVYQEDSQTEQALTVLNQALDLAEPEEIIAPFIVEGPQMVPLLRKALEHDRTRTFVGQLQASFLPTVGAAAQPLIEPLTNRELEVLHMMADGLSNPEIADQLILATGTIAKHTNNIFGKLGVRNRTEATHRAQVLGLL